MEMMEGGELFDRISQHKHFTERQAAFYTMQVGGAGVEKVGGVGVWCWDD